MKSPPRKPFPGRRIAPRKPAPQIHDPVGPFLHYLMAECGVSPHTLAAYRSDLMRFIRWRKSKAPVELAKLDAIALGDYVDSLHRPSSHRRASAGTWQASQRSSVFWSSKAVSAKTSPSC